MLYFKLQILLILQHGTGVYDCGIKLFIFITWFRRYFKKKSSFSHVSIYSCCDKAVIKFFKAVSVLMEVCKVLGRIRTSVSAFTQ